MNDPEQAPEPQGGEPLSGEPLSGEPLSGEPLSGEPLGTPLAAAEPQSVQPGVAQPSDPQPTRTQPQELDEPKVDVSDLKTYDVPDPPEQSATCLRMFIGVPLGLVLALGLLKVTAASHYFAVAANPAEYSHNRESARRFINELPPAEITDAVLEIEDLATRGGFHKVLAATKDPAQIEAIAAFVQAYRGYEIKEVKQALESLRAFPQEDAVSALVALGSAPDPQNESRDRMARNELEQNYPPEAALQGVLKIEDEVKRGAFYWVLPSSKDPDQITAIMAYVATQGTRSATTGRRYGVNPDPADFKAEAAALIAFGKPATPKLKEALHSKQGSIVNLAAEALAKVNLEFLHGYCREELGEYAKRVPGQRGLAWASFVVSNADRPGGLAKIGAKLSDVSAAKRIFADAARHSARVMEMLKAMESLKGEKIDYCFIHGLSCYDRQVAEYCAKLLQSRLKTDELIDVLFSFIAQKDSFTTQEVKVYETMLLGTGSAGAVRVAWNLDRLYKESKGKPEAVFFLYKKMGFRVLNENGRKAQLSTLELFAEDSDSYVKTSTSRSGQRSETEVKFKVEVAAAMRAIKSRGR